MKKISTMFTLLLALALSSTSLQAQWLLTGNAGVGAADYLGPQNDTPLNFKVNLQKAGMINSTGITTFGYQAGNVNTSGECTAFGHRALANNTIATNAAFGDYALTSVIAGKQNAAFGSKTLFSNIADDNSAFGHKAMMDNTLGTRNVALGSSTLRTNTLGNNNTAIGTLALYLNTGSNNTAVGYNACSTNTSGTNNTSLGASSGVTLTGLTNTTALGANATVAVSNKVRIGNTTVTVIEGQVAYTNPSDGRFKTNVTEDVPGLDFITRLRPVVYNFDTRKFDEFLLRNASSEERAARLSETNYAPSTAIRQTGFIAQEVEKVAQEIGYDFNGVHRPVDENDNYSVSYSQFVMPLVKSVQELNATNMALQARLDAQDALIQKLLAQQGASDVSKAALDLPSLSQNVPNPANGETTIQYYVPESMTCAQGACKLVVHDAAGRRVQEFAVSAGHGSVSLQLPSAGMYSYQLIVNNAVVASKNLSVVH